MKFWDKIDNYLASELIIGPSGIEITKKTDIIRHNVKLIIGPSGIEMRLLLHLVCHLPVPYNWTKWN